MKKRFDLYLPIELYERIKIISNNYNQSITQIIVKLLELGYLEFYKQSYRKEIYENKNLQ